MSLYFIAFIVIGSLLVLNLFVGEIVNTYSRLANNTIMMSMEQRQWAMAVRMKMEQAGSTVIDTDPPEEEETSCGCWGWVLWFRTNCYYTCISPMFEQIIMGVIVLNILTMSMAFYNQPEDYESMLDDCNTIFSWIFICEFGIKISGLGPEQYFSDAWNLLDVSVVIVSILGMTGLGASGLSVFRALRMLRVAKLIKSMRGLRSLLTTLFFSLPALGNVGLLLLLTVFIFGVLGMNLFGKVAYDQDGFITETNNFQTVGRSMLLLFRVLTFDDWRGIMEGCMVQEPQCSEALDNCGSVLAVPFFVLFSIIGTFMMLNIFTAVILLNFQSAALDEGLADIGFVSGAMFKMQRVDELIMDLQERWILFKRLQPRRYPEFARLEKVGSYLTKGTRISFNPNPNGKGDAKEGEIVSVMPDGRRAVIFDDGNVEKYDAEVWDRIKVVQPATQG